MSLVDRALRWEESGEDFAGAPAQDEEFVMSHCDNVRSTGFLEHIKLPHYVDFQSELELVRKMRREAADAASAPPQPSPTALSESGGEGEDSEPAAAATPKPETR